MTMLEDMLQFAQQEAPNEACGLVVATGKRQRLQRAKNIAANPTTTFDLDPDAWLQIGDDESVVGIFHSHPMTSAEPSMADLAGCEASAMPWHIINPQTAQYVYFEPTGFVTPYAGRPYVHGVLDCFTIVRDWYKREANLELPNFRRTDGWWERGEDLYVDNYGDCGFERLIDQPCKRGDLFLIQVASKVPNHAAVFLGGDQILHHAQGRLSRIDVYGGMWEKCTSHHLRHPSTAGLSNG